jgi:phenylacetate-CoA ligase
VVEVPDPNADADATLAGLAEELAGAHENLRFGVRRVEVETLPRFELKAKRVLDERTLIGSEGEARGQA